MYLSGIRWHKDVNFINFPESLVYEVNNKCISIHFTYKILGNLECITPFNYVHSEAFEKNEAFEKS